MEFPFVHTKMRLHRKNVNYCCSFWKKNKNCHVLSEEYVIGWLVFPSHSSMYIRRTSELNNSHLLNVMNGLPITKSIFNEKIILRNVLIKARCYHVSKGELNKLFAAKFQHIRIRKQFQRFFSSFICFMLRAFHLISIPRSSSFEEFLRRIQHKILTWFKKRERKKRKRISIYCLWCLENKELFFILLSAMLCCCPVM